VRVAYEAGPTGFTLARALGDLGIECVIAAPGKIERPPQDRGEDLAFGDETCRVMGMIRVVRRPPR
jgi:transposase